MQCKVDKQASEGRQKCRLCYIAYQPGHQGWPMEKKETMDVNFSLLQENGSGFW